MPKFISAQPAYPYYEWQVEVYINNFMKHGIKAEDIIVLCSIDSEIPNNWKKIQNHYKGVNFHFYNDTREYKGYIPSIYFHLMKKYLTEFPELSKQQFFLHDSDIILTRPLQLDWINKYSNIWYMSDTNSYINYNYIISKGEHIYLEMCKIVGLDPLVPKLMNNNSGGAQYIVKGEGANFWEKVESDSNKLYEYFCSEEPNYIKKHDGDYPIQKWTAGMWSLLWNTWLSGHPTEVKQELYFCWSTDVISRVDRDGILHNAGVVDNTLGLFFKGDYINKSPYGLELNIDKTKCSYYYWNEIQETAKKTALI